MKIMNKFIDDVAIESDGDDEEEQQRRRRQKKKRIRKMNEEDDEGLYFSDNDNENPIDKLKRARMKKKLPSDDDDDDDDIDDEEELKKDSEFIVFSEEEEDEERKNDHISRLHLLREKMEKDEDKNLLLKFLPRRDDNSELKKLQEENEKLRQQLGNQRQSSATILVPGSQFIWEQITYTVIRAPNRPLKTIPTNSQDWKAANICPKTHYAICQNFTTNLFEHFFLSSNQPLHKITYEDALLVESFLGKKEKQDRKDLALSKHNLYDTTKGNLILPVVLYEHYLKEAELIAQQKKNRNQINAAKKKQHLKPIIDEFNQMKDKLTPVLHQMFKQFLQQGLGKDLKHYFVKGELSSWLKSSNDISKIIQEQQQQDPDPELPRYVNNMMTLMKFLPFLNEDFMNEFILQLDKTQSRSLPRS